MEDIRCGGCSKKLATGVYIELSIKCPRCRTINHLKAASLLPERLERPCPQGGQHEAQPHRPVDRRKTPSG